MALIYIALHTKVGSEIKKLDLPIIPSTPVPTPTNQPRLRLPSRYFRLVHSSASYNRNRMRNHYSFPFTPFKLETEWWSFQLRHFSKVFQFDAVGMMYIHVVGVGFCRKFFRASIKLGAEIAVEETKNCGMHATRADETLELVLSLSHLNQHLCITNNTQRDRARGCTCMAMFAYASKPGCGCGSLV